MMKKLVLMMASVVVFAAGHAMAEVKLPALFSDNAVLQQGMPVPVWGTAKDGEKVTVEFAGQTETTTAKDGRWMVRLKPMEANATPQTMTVTGANTITVTNLLVGEMWICSGQSNMGLTLRGAAEGGKALQTCADPQLRLFAMSNRGASQPVSMVQGEWTESSPASASGFSAVGYFFGRDLRKARQVPVGLISTFSGGSPAEKWTSRQSLAANPQLAHYTTNPPSAKGPSSFYNGMIAPLQPVAMAGVIWYQGESNSDSIQRAKEYRILFPALIKNWRDDWGQGEFPFLFVQIAPCPLVIPEIREAQLISWGKVPKSAMVVITDHGAGKIHPRAKEPVGVRLALAARAVAYGEKIEYSGPVYQSWKVDGNRAVLSFTHVGGGLVAKGGDLKGFTIAGTDKKFLPATAKIEGKTVIVSSPDVAQPVAVRYGWENFPRVNLFNKEDLPASPFRTDVE